MEFKAVKIFFPPRDWWTSPGSDSFGPPTGTRLASHHCDAGLFQNGKHFRHSWNAGRRQTKNFPSGFKTILKILHKWSSDQTKLNYNTGKFVEGRRKKFSKFGSRPKNFKVFRGRKNSKCSRPKNFKVFEARKIFKVA